MVEEKKVPEGYKVTEVGVIPEDWEVKRLGELGECIIGLTYKPDNVKEDGLLVLRSSNIGGNKLKFDDKIFVDIDVNERLIVRKDDILICVRNGSRALIGKCALIDGKATGSTFGAFMSVYRSEFSKYIFYYFQSNMIKRQINENIGATINQITNKNLNSFSIAIPNESVEQQAIAEVLTDVDNLISSLEKLIDKKGKIKQGAMQELLTGKRRLPGFDCEWEVNRIGEIADVVTGGTPPTRDSKNYGGEYFFVSPADLGKNKYIIDTEKKLSLKGFNIAKKFPKDSILFTCIGSTIGKCGIAPIELTSNQQINAVLPNDKYSTDFVFYLLKYRSLEIKVSASEQAVPIINKSTFESIQLVIAKDIKEQQAIAQILSDMDAEIESLNQKLQKYKAIKQGMMQELLTGRVRLV